MKAEFSFQSIPALTYPDADRFLLGDLAQLQPRMLGHSWRIFTDAADGYTAEQPAQLQMENYRWKNPYLKYFLTQHVVSDGWGTVIITICHCP